MTYSDMMNTLKAATIRCGNCKDRHVTVHDVRECYDLTLVMEAYFAESQADYLTDLAEGR